jgi:hypothetical protein
LDRIPLASSPLPLFSLALSSEWPPAGLLVNFHNILNLNFKYIW